MSSEEERSWPITGLLYWWVSPLLSRGWKRNKEGDILYESDLLQLPQDEEAVRAYQLFKEKWAEELELTEQRKKKNPKALPRLFRTLLRCYIGHVIIAGVCRFLSDGSMLAMPFVLREIITWMGKYTFTGGPNKWEGFVYSVCLGVVLFSTSFFNNACLYYNSKAFCQMKSSVAMAIFDKALVMPSDHGMSGIAIQLHTTDASKFIELAFFFHLIWSSPVFVIAALIALYFFVGWAGVISLGIMIVFLPFQGFIMNRITAMRRSSSRLADARLGALNEMLQGIRIVKFMGWETPLKERILTIRRKELRIFRWAHSFRSAMMIIITIQPVIVTFCVFVIAWALDDPINPKSVFPAIAMLNFLRMPLAMLPASLARLVDMFVSMGRITTFLVAREKVTYLKEASLGNYAIEAVNTTSQYYLKETEEYKDILTNVNVRIPKHKLTIIVGATGCGKTSLVQALIGEARVTPESSVTVDGSLAYVPQEAWIMNATLRDNILLGKPFDEALYLRTVKACQLMADLKELKASDGTEIGESGVNVSGGQKQRVAFARAVYSNRDIVVMDDPLSAVDAHVSLALFNNCICGVLAGKTRVLVTHQVQYLPKADHIIVMDDCSIKFAGTYSQLVAARIDVGSLVHSSVEEEKKKAEIEEKAVEVDKLAEDEMTHGKHEEEKIPEASTDALMTLERQEQGGVKLATIKTYYGYQGVCVVLTMFFFFILWRVVSIVADLMVSWWSSRTDVLGYSLSDEQYILWFGVFIAAQIPLLIIRQVPYVIGSTRASRRNTEEMLHRVVRAPTSFFDTTPLGRVVARFSKDVEMIDQMIPDILNVVYNLVLVVLGAVAVMIYSAYYLVILIVILVVIFVFMFRYYTCTNRAQRRLEAIARSPMASLITQTLGGLESLRAYGARIVFEERHTKAINAASRASYSCRNANRWFSLRVDSMSTLIALGTSCVGCGLIISYDRDERLNLLPIMALAITYSSSIGSAIGFLTTIMAELESAMSSVERCKEYAEEIPQERDITYGKEHPPPPPEWPAHGSVEFEKVNLRYAPEKPLVLKDVSMKVKAGHKIGIVGRTGSGKSTLMLALFRMVEIESGAIRIDGVKTTDVTMEDLRSKLTIIPQDPMLFSGTIRSNLDPFNRYTDEEVMKAVETVGLTDRISRNGKGLEEVVADRGSNFSVGQRQLLCLARAMLKKCKVLLLDEATANVDFEADALIQRTIHQSFTNCTVLTIAHRLATVIESDKVMVMDHGVLVEYDHPANLLERKSSHFQGMVAALGQVQFTKLLQAAQRHRSETHEPISHN